MPKNKSNDQVDRLYVGVDVGGTKVQTSLVEESGVVFARSRCATPRDDCTERIVTTIETAIEEALRKADVEPTDVASIGIGVPGVVDPDTGRVVVTPNMNLTGVNIRSHLESRFKLPVAVGNDGNLGALGERWLGSARGSLSVVSICVGTGIGCGIVQGGKLWCGARGAAGEIGHMVMQLGGPTCGCGGQGCFEALAGRKAIERDIRDAVAAGRTTILTELADGDLSIIRSGMLRRALEAEDALVTEVMRRASTIIGTGCLTVRHLIDPEVIVLGGGVIEACSEFMMPIIENIVGNDRLPGARSAGGVLLSALGDDAVALGAVALARMLVGRSPFKKRFQVSPIYPEITHYSFGEITIGNKSYGSDIYIRVNGKVKKRKKSEISEDDADSLLITPLELEKVCRGGPESLIIGSGQAGTVEMNDEAQRYLEQRAIHWELLPTPEAVDAYNRSELRKAALIHVTR